MATRVVRQDEKGLYINGDGEKCRPTEPTVAKVGDRYNVKFCHGLGGTAAWVRTGCGKWNDGTEHWVSDL